MINATPLARPTASRTLGTRSWTPYVPAILNVVSAVLWNWRCRLVERETLAHMDDRMLQDIGISRTEAYKEANKPFLIP